MSRAVMMFEVPVCEPEAHEAVKADPERWLGLPFVGLQSGCGGVDLCLRNCRCLSTLAKPTAVEVWVGKGDAL